MWLSSALLAAGQEKREEVSPWAVGRLPLVGGKKLFSFGASFTRKLFEQKVDVGAGWSSKSKVGNAATDKSVVLVDDDVVGLIERDYL